MASQTPRATTRKTSATKAQPKAEPKAAPPATQAVDEDARDVAALLATPPRFHPKAQPVPEGYIAMAAPESFGDVVRVMPAEEYAARLARLEAVFEQDRVEKLPRQVVSDKKDPQQTYGRCEEGSTVRVNGRQAATSADGYFCGGWHARSIHLDYIGHAGLTERLLEVDPLWSYEWKHVELPGWVEAAVAASYAVGNTDEARRLVKQHGAPLSRDGGYWIDLTILGITRQGFGSADGKTGPNATKEVIGDALRNAGMRFGAGTYLWSKSDHAIALRTGAEEPAAEEQAALTEAAFWKQVEQAFAAPDVARALTDYGRGIGEEPLRALTVTLRNGDTATAYDVLRGAIAEANERAHGGAQTRLDGARTQGARADEGARAQDQESAQHEARAQESRARADAVIAKQAERAASPERLQRARLVDELFGQANVLGITPDDHLRDLFSHPRAPKGVTIDTIDLRVLKVHVFGRRAEVIAALRQQGRASEAEHYERAAAASDQPETWQRLVEGAPSEERAHDAEPAAAQG